MIKRVNFTGRRRIPSKRVTIEVFDGTPRSFDVELNLQGCGFPDHGTVIIEATCAGSSQVLRFNFGRVDAIKPPTERHLAGLNGKNVFFSLKVIDQTEKFGRILGLAENIRPVLSGAAPANGRRGILPIEQVDLGERVWKLEFREREVFLLVNNSIPEIMDHAGGEPLFYANVYPEVVARILDRALSENVDIEEDDDRWPILWLRYGKHLHPEQALPPAPDDSEACEEWVDQVVSAFCNRYTLGTKYAAAASGGESL